jgi:hypothetical protein
VDARNDQVMGGQGRAVFRRLERVQSRVRGLQKGSTRHEVCGAVAMPATRVPDECADASGSGRVEGFDRESSFIAVTLPPPRTCASQQVDVPRWLPEGDISPIAEPAHLDPRRPHIGEPAPVTRRGRRSEEGTQCAGGGRDNCVVTLNVDHDLTPMRFVRFEVPRPPGSQSVGVGE